MPIDTTTFSQVSRLRVLSPSVDNAEEKKSAVSISQICDQFRSYTSVFFGRWNIATTEARIRTLRKLLSHGNTTDIISDLVDWAVDEKLLSLFTQEDPPHFLATVSGRAEVSGVMNVFLRFVHHHADQVQKAVVRERQHIFEQLACKYRRDMNTRSILKAKERQLQFLRSQESVSKYFRKAQASVSRNTALKESVYRFVQRCVVTVRSYSFINAYSKNMMLKFKEAGYVAPSWVNMEKCVATNNAQAPTITELKLFMDLLHAFYLTDANFERSQVCQHMTLDTLLCAVKSDGLLVSSDMKDSTSFTFTGAQLNQWMLFLFVFGFVYARSLLVFSAAEDTPCKPPTLTAAQEEKLVESWRQANRLRNTGMYLSAHT